MSGNIIGSATTLSAESQFIYVTADVTITLPATPVVGQIVQIVIWEDGPGQYTLDPNGNPLRAAGVDYPNPLNIPNAVKIIFYNARWYFI